MEERQLAGEEKELTENILKENEKKLRYLKFQEKKSLLDLESIPLVREQHNDKLSEIRKEIKMTEQQIEDGKKLLRR